MKKICILGATGSIGCSTLEVVALHPERFSVIGITGFNQIERLVDQALQFQVRYVVVPTPEKADTFKNLWQERAGGQPLPDISVGAKALVQLAEHSEVDVVMAAIVGAAGLPATLAAAQAGKRVLLANKEALVVAGTLFMQAVHSSQAELLPIDSEHNAIFQCMPPLVQGNAAKADRSTIKRLWLTASGGPFRETPLSEMANITPEQACKHPQWSMGKKISVDSATMMNKGLEVIEAHWLFSIAAKDISVLIHPQSVVHSMVEYIDGSVLAQKGTPDMRIPIAYGMAYPERIVSGAKSLQLAEIARLDFYAPDFERFPCLRLAYDALSVGQAACVVLNAANEIAVDAFLNKMIRFLDIAVFVEQALTEFYKGQVTNEWRTIEDLLALDALTRQKVQTAIVQSV